MADASKIANSLPKDGILIANLSGRGDKDVEQASKYLLGCTADFCTGQLRRAVMVAKARRWLNRFMASWKPLKVDWRRFLRWRLQW